jgi:hypothetical protein
MRLAAYRAEFKALERGYAELRLQHQGPVAVNQARLNRAAPFQIRATIVSMQIAVFAMRVLEAMFFVGLAGSAIVVLISFVEDAKELFGED